MSPIEKVRSYLCERDPNIRIIEFEQDTSTADLAAQALGTESGQIAKSILLRSKSEEYLLVVSAGDVKIDNRKIKEMFGSRLRMARPEEVEEVTGFSIGGVCPFALKTNIPVFLDESLKRYQVVYAAAGTPHTAVPVTYQQLARITTGQPCQVTERISSE